MKPLDPSARPSHPEFDVHLTENVMLPMRDGVRLATDIYRPTRASHPLTNPRPVLLHRTPYNKVETEATGGECRYFAARGYVVVNQDCRACFSLRGRGELPDPRVRGRRRHLGLGPQAALVRRHGGHLRHLVGWLDSDRSSSAGP